MKVGALGGDIDLHGDAGRFVVRALLRKEFHLTREETAGLKPREVRRYLAVLAGLADAKKKAEQDARDAAGR